jgi:hypothetical protein
MANYFESRNAPNGPSGAPNSVRSRPPEEKISLCYYDGPFKVAVPMPPRASPFATTRLSVLVFEDGHVEFEGVGSRESFAATGPAS